MGEAIAMELKIVHAAALRLLRGKVIEPPCCSPAGAPCSTTCRAAMAFRDNEQFRILFLDKKNQLIADEVQQAGHSRPHARLYSRGDEARAGLSAPPPSSWSTTILRAIPRRRLPTSR